MNILQIGSNNGNDQVFHFVKTHDVKTLVLIDALEECVAQTKLQYKDIPIAQCMQLCASTHELPYQKFYKPNNPRTDVASVNPIHLAAHLERDIVEVVVPSKHINQIIKDFPADKIDRFYLDAEGLDCDLLLALDLSIKPIDFIEFEGGHSDGPHRIGAKYFQVLQKFSQQGYKFQTRPPVFNNTIIIRNEMDWANFENDFKIINYSLDGELNQTDKH